ncbi:MAG TPA: hypothetical protein VFX23_10135 [Limnobacter sp.]|uniref:hypothetical protein n=1 Tax=Limnobacter sp. TaxID=2003368 RepID=UPI002E32FC6F|nr:hypothetical protein [Limnobacter sp.]HEX5486343.1 hypothetical protein [Limnobacter sp.]
MELIKFGKLEPRLVSNSDFEPPKVKIEGNLKLLESLTHQERIALFADVGAVWHPPQHPNISLHRAEQRAIQDYMSAPDQSKMINHFLRGEIPQNLGLKTPKDLREFALLMISGLNALPSQTVISMHTLPANSPMFKAMVEAAQTGKPFSPDYFLSVTPLSEEHAADQHTPPNRSLGDTAILIRSNISKDVSSVNQIYAQEKESIIPPYVSFQVKPVKSVGANKPALELVEDTTVKTPATDNRK